MVVGLESDEIFGGREVVVGDDGGVGRDHLPVDVLHHYRASGGVGDGIVVGYAYVGVHVDALEEFQGLFDRGCAVEDVLQGGGRCEVGLAAVLMGLDIVAGHQVRDGETLLVDAVES